MDLKYLAASGLVAWLAAASGPSFGQSSDASLKSAYAGQENRQIKSLSAKDIDDLSNGRGWGLAKAAELNGLPGPTHILEMADKIDLSPEQRRKIEGLFETMKSRAVPLGKQLVELERGLDRLFRDKSVNQNNLKTQLNKIGKVRSALRLVHLQTHLRTPEILTRHQIVTYNRLRGYAGTDDSTAHHGGGHKK